MPEKVLVVSNLYPPHIVGGAELVAHYQARELQRAGCKVHVFAGEGHRTGVHYAVETGVYDGITVDRILLNSGDFASESVNFHHPQVEAAFNATLDRVRPDVVHMHNITGLSASMVSLTARRSIPVAVTLHDHWGFCLRNTIITTDNLICRDFTQCALCQSSINGPGDPNLPVRTRNDYLWFHLEYASALIFPSQYLAGAYARAGFRKERMNVIWNGVDVERFAKVRKRPDPHCMRFTFIGYLGEHKGVMVLLEALRLIGGRAPLLVNIVGEGHLRRVLEARVSELGLSEKVRFWGKVPHEAIERVFEHTDVQVTPSIWPENQPVSITEAMATRTPVIASRVGGIPELVEDRHTGLLCNPADAAQLAEKMLNLLDRPALVDEMGGNAFARIQGASLNRQSMRILQLYKSLRPLCSVRLDRSLIVCCGPRFDYLARRAIERISAQFGVYRHAFLMQEWISADHLGDAVAALVLPGAASEQVFSLMRNAVPLIVPNQMSELADLCRRESCGLYYSTAEEAAESLVWLIDNPPDRDLLANNALRVSTLARMGKRTSGD